MKHFYLNFFLTSLLLQSISFLSAQTTEDFEDETIASSTFTSNGQLFNVTSTSGETYDIFNCAGCGWNGSTTDAQFIENSSGSNGTNNGSSFIVKTNDGTDINVSSLYIFCSTTGLANHTGSLTLTGNKDGLFVFSISKNSGFSNVSTLSPNNGFTFINFATDGSSDFSNTAIDELIFTSTGNLDYMALDAFTWKAHVLSSDEFTVNRNPVKIYPNPSSTDIQLIENKHFTEYQIYNLLGDRVQRGNISENSKINISHLSKGLYLVHLDKSVTIKFIKN